MTITKHHTITNTTDKFLLVGNSSEVIAAYDSKEEAIIGLEVEVPSIEDSKWGSVVILAPGDTDSGNYSQLLPQTASEKAEISKQIEDFFGV